MEKTKNKYYILYMEKIKILTIREPFATSLLSGVHPAEMRKFRLEGPTLIHSAKTPAMSPEKAMEYFLERGDVSASEALNWVSGDGEEPEDITSDVAVSIVASALEFGEAFPFGRVIGYVEGWENSKSGIEWENKPVNPVRFPISQILPKHNGALGFLPANKNMLDSIAGLLPRKEEKDG